MFKILLMLSLVAWVSVAARNDPITEEMEKPKDEPIEKYYYHPAPDQQAGGFRRDCSYYDEKLDQLTYKVSRIFDLVENLVNRRYQPYPYPPSPGYYSDGSSFEGWRRRRRSHRF